MIFIIITTFTKKSNEKPEQVANKFKLNYIYIYIQRQLDF